MNYQIKNRVVGVDISVKRTTYAIVDIRGNILARNFFPTNDYANVNDFITVLCEKVIELTEQNGGYENIRSMGISESKEREIIKIAQGHQRTRCQLPDRMH